MRGIKPMTGEQHVQGCGCGCQADNGSTDRVCPACGGKLRMTGSLQTLKMNLTCPACGYFSPRLEPEEVWALID